MSMNVIENVVAKKNTVVPYKYRRYPLELYKPGERALKVHDEAAEEAALENGYTENPPAIPESVAVAPMTTQPAIQAAYEALKKELEGKTLEFNRKHAALQADYAALKHETIELRAENLTYLNRANQAPEPAPEHPPTDEPQSDNPFAQMK